MDSPVHRLLRYIREYINNSLPPGIYTVCIDTNKIVIFDENRSIMKTLTLDNKILSSDDISLLKRRTAILERKAYLLDKVKYAEEPKIPLCAKYNDISLCIEGYSSERNVLIGYLYVNKKD